MRNSIYMLIASLLFSVSCDVKPKEISYGEAACDFCRMTIVDNQHAAQLVTNKGKVFNFDAAECMINYTNEIDNNTIGLLLVSDYNHPGILIDVESATFIISKAIPSPMGANLSAFSDSEDAEKIQKEKGGNLYDWHTLNTHLKD